MKEIVVEKMCKLTDEEVEKLSGADLYSIESPYAYIEEDEFETIKMSEEARNMMTALTVEAGAMFDQKRFLADRHLQKSDIIGVLIEGKNAKTIMRNGEFINYDASNYLTKSFKDVYVWRSVPIGKWSYEEIEESYDLYRMVIDVHDAIVSVGLGNDLMESKNVEEQFILTKEEIGIINRFFSEHPVFYEYVQNKKLLDENDSHLLFAIRYV